MSTTPPPDPNLDPVTFTVEQIHLTIDRLREAWSWLCDLIEPSRTTAGPTSALTDAQAERLEAIGHSDRAYRQWNLRHGMSALPPSPAAAHLAVIDAQAAVAAAVDTAVRITASALAMSYVGARTTLAESVPAALDWLTGDSHHQGVVDELRDERAAAGVDRVLQRADRAARAAARCLDDEVEPLPERCPACGQRSLQREADHGGGNRVVRCVSQRCRCTGDGDPDTPPCGCRQQHRRPGRAHVWTAGQLDGPHGLWAAIAARARPRPPARRGARGHGGWQSRDMAGQQ